MPIRYNELVNKILDKMHWALLEKDKLSKSVQKANLLRFEMLGMIQTLKKKELMSFENEYPSVWNLINEHPKYWNAKDVNNVYTLLEFPTDKKEIVKKVRKAMKQINKDDYDMFVDLGVFEDMADMVYGDIKNDSMKEIKKHTKEALEIWNDKLGEHIGDTEDEFNGAVYELGMSLKNGDITDREHEKEYKKLLKEYPQMKYIE